MISSPKANPFKIGDKVIFKPTDRAYGWYWPYFDRFRLHPGDEGIVTRIHDGVYLYLDDDRGGFAWDCFEKVS
jgi:hypothetical protein